MDPQIPHSLLVSSVIGPAEDFLHGTFHLRGKRWRQYYENWRHFTARSYDKNRHLQIRIIHGLQTEKAWAPKTQSNRGEIEVKKLGQPSSLVSQKDGGCRQHQQCILLAQSTEWLMQAAFASSGIGRKWRKPCNSIGQLGRKWSFALSTKESTTYQGNNSDLTLHTLRLLVTTFLSTQYMMSPFPTLISSHNWDQRSEWQMRTPGPSSRALHSCIVYRPVSVFLELLHRKSHSGRHLPLKGEDGIGSRIYHSVLCGSDFFLLLCVQKGLILFYCLLVQLRKFQHWLAWLSIGVTLS